MLSQEILKYGDKKSYFYSNEKETVMVVRCAFSRFEGKIEENSYLRIALNIGGGGIIKEYYGSEEIRKNWRKGTIYIGLGEPCNIDCPPVEILGIAVNLKAWFDEGLCNYSKSDFSFIADNPASDSFVSSMLKTLWESASIYGADTEFFNSGCLQILDRLVNKQATKINRSQSKVLPEAALAIVDKLIDKQMEQRITIAEMAASINMEEANFARSFTYTMEQTPFAYLTYQRIQRAQSLLRLGNDITSTAISVGYRNPSKFSAAFRRFTGKSPSEWKRSVIS